TASSASHRWRISHDGGCSSRRERCKRAASQSARSPRRLGTPRRPRSTVHSSVSSARSPYSTAAPGATRRDEPDAQSYTRRKSMNARSFASTWRWLEVPRKRRAPVGEHADQGTSLEIVRDHVRKDTRDPCSGPHQIEQNRGVVRHDPRARLEKHFRPVAFELPAGARRGPPTAEISSILYVVIQQRCDITRYTAVCPEGTAAAESSAAGGTARAG